MTRQLNLLLALLLLLIGGPIWYLLLDSSPWSVKPAALNLDLARKLAAEMPGPLPERVEYEVVSRRSVSGNLFVAGSGLKSRELGVLAYLLIVPGKPAIMIETGTTPEHSQKLGFERFDRAAQGRIDQTVRDAEIVLVTHEHGDHLGGLADLVRRENSPRLIAKARLNRHQVPGEKADSALPWPPGVKIPPLVDFSGQQAVAPGVVIIPTPGHTPGSQMIFVKLAGGTEYLFVGDTAPMAVSWGEVRPPSRLVTDFWVPQDRRSMIGWLKALKQAKQRQPALQIIPGHDLEWLTDPANAVPVTRMRDGTGQKQAGN